MRSAALLFPIVLAWGLVAWGLLASGCSDLPSDETPRGAVRLFLSAMARSEEDPAALREAYGLLSEPTRRALVERERFAESLGASELHPWDMIVRARHRPSFAPARGARGMRERIDGDSATVVVTNEDGSRTAEVPLVREDGRWRIVLSIPPVRGED